MEDFFDVGEILYQKFLLDIYMHCDKLHLPIPTDEKEKMAFDMVEFVGKVVNSLESKEPLLKIENRNARTMRKISRVISENVGKDHFAKSVINYYISKNKVSRSELDTYLTIAALAVLSKCKRTDLKLIEQKIENAKPYIFRVASLLSPAVALHEKLFEKCSIDQEDIAERNMSFLKYIG